MIKHNYSDMDYIEQQLGRKPRGIVEISVRNKDGQPVVVKTKPVLAESRKSPCLPAGRKVESGSEIFPTLYYLVCGDVVQKVSKLESEGFIAKMQKIISKDKSFRTNFLKAQEEYKQERNSLVNLKELSDSQKEALDTGIGGVKELDKVKCLHAHLAHYLATGKNVVGEEVAEILHVVQDEKIDCHSERA